MANYDPNVDYSDLIADAVKRGDYAAAAQYEQQRNAKIDGEGKNQSLKTNSYTQYLPQENSQQQKQKSYTPTGNVVTDTVNQKLPGLLSGVVDGAKRFQEENKYNYIPGMDRAYGEEYNAAKAQQDALFEKIMNREPFSYNPEADPIYQQYRQQYTALGKTAMRDTMGQAAALTGGYGSTYSQQAGQQAYDAYLARLNDVLPDLYGDAYNRWQNEGNALLNQYSLASGRADDAYNRGYNAWATRLNLEREDEQRAEDRKRYEDETAYQRGIDERNWKYQQEQDAWSRQQDDRSYLVSLISATGYNPTDAELQAAGMTRAEANALIDAYKQTLAAASFSSGGGGSSGGRSSGGSSGRRSSGGSYSGGGGTQTVTPEPAKPKVDDPAAISQCRQSLKLTLHYGGSKTQLKQQILRWVDEGIISESTEDLFYEEFGLNEKENEQAENKTVANSAVASKLPTKPTKATK